VTGRRSARVWRRGLTLVEVVAILVLVVFGLFVLTVFIAQPSRSGPLAKRTQCAANLRAIAQSCLIYSEANQGWLPAASPEATESVNTVVGYRRGWSDTDESTEESGPKYASPTRSYYKLLVGGRRAFLQPKQLICPSAPGLGHDRSGTLPEVEVTKETLADFPAGTQIGSEAPYYDFDGLRTDKGRLTRETGPSEMIEFSYSFQMTRRAGGRGVKMTNSRDPRLALAADRNPFSNYVAYSDGQAMYQFRIANNSGCPVPGMFKGRIDFVDALKRNDKSLNSRNHKQDGQNVAFLDGHAKWYKTSLAGADDDCIWTISDPPTTSAPAGSDLLSMHVYPQTGTRSYNPSNYVHMLSDRETTTDSLLLP
jgi:prepilin-type processing-associated H-X9-DG protein